MSDVDDLVSCIGLAVADSFWHMSGGTGPSPEPPSTVDLQVAHDVALALQAAGLARLLRERLGRLAEAGLLLIGLLEELDGS